jgi:hypothetical protein
LSAGELGEADDHGGQQHDDIGGRTPGHYPLSRAKDDAFDPGSGATSSRSRRFRRLRPLPQDRPHIYTLRRWTAGEGSCSFRVNYSDQTVTIE